MTKEQAIEYLKADIKHWENTSVSTEHLEMAIKALEQQPSEDCVSREFIKIIVEYPPEDLCTYPEYKGKPYFSIVYRENGEEFVGYGTYKPEVLTDYLKRYFMPTISYDCVSRERIKQIVSNITAEYDTETIHVDRLMDEIDDMPPVTPTIPSSEDCVSRAQALSAIRNLYPSAPFVRMNLKKWHEENKKYFECEDIIKALPPVTPTHGICKDCKHWDKDIKQCDNMCRCKVHKGFYSANYFCGDFEKRGDENESIN